MKNSKQEIDQHVIGLYVCERSSDVRKSDIIQNL